MPLELAVETAGDESLLAAPFDNAGKGCEAGTSTDLPHKGCEFSKCGNWADDSKGKMCVTHKILSPMPRTYVQEKEVGTLLQPQHWRGGDGKTPGAHWPASLSESVSSRPVRERERRCVYIGVCMCACVCA